MVFGLFVFRPVPIPQEKDCLIATGLVADVFEGGDKDIVFRLHGQAKTFYINRGLERGFTIDKLRTDLTNKEIVIKYPSYWTPLNANASVRHISKIEYQGQTLFTELE